MKIIGKKLAIALITASMATVPSLNANAQQQGAGTVMGMSTATAAVLGVIVVGAIAYNVNSNDDDSRVVIPTTPPVTPPTTTTTASTTTTN